MNEKHHVERDMAITFDFLRYMVDHPGMIDDLPDGAEIDFISSDIVSTAPAEDPKRLPGGTLIATRRSFELLPSSRDPMSL